VIELASEPDRYSLASVEEDGAEEDERRAARGGDLLAIQRSCRLLTGRLCTHTRD
jgi:hypothetical protein